MDPDDPSGAGSLRVPPRRHGRLRRALFSGVERSLAALGGRAFYRRRFLARGRFRVRHEEIAIRALPVGLEGFRLAQLSDFHGGRFLGRGDLDAVIEAVNELEPDVCALTGDFISHHWSEALPLAEAFGRLRPRRGTFAVFGNHDYKDRAEARIAAAYAEHGVEFLRDECRRLTVAGAAQDPALALIGLEDLEEARDVDFARARAGVRPGDIEVYLCHNPRGGPPLARAGARLVLSGHTHGGQIDLPFLRRLGPAHPGSRLELGECTLLVSNGLGVVGVPLRVGAPAEVVSVRLVRSERAVSDRMG